MQASQKPPTDQIPPEIAAFLDQIPGAKEVGMRLNSYEPNISRIVHWWNGPLEKMFIEDAVATNEEELKMMYYAVDRVENPMFKADIQLMILMHEKDLTAAKKLLKMVNHKDDVDLTNQSVYPGTPDWDLGKRKENLDEEYYDRLVGQSKVSFDELAMNLIHDIHIADVQSEITAEYRMTNPYLRSFAKHSADVTEYHIQLMNYVNDTQFLGIPPVTDFTK